MRVAQISDLEQIFNNVVSAALALAGIVFFVLLLSAGFKYITSGGDPKAIDAAQKTITYAVLGLVLILASYLILVVISKVTGADVTGFKLSFP